MFEVEVPMNNLDVQEYDLVANTFQGEESLVQEDNSNKREEKVTQSKDNSNDSECFKFKPCEMCKEVDFCSKMRGTVRILKLNVHLKHLCKNKKVAIAIQLINPKTNKVVTQKGAIVETLNEECERNVLVKCFEFAFPNDICEDSDRLCVKLITNYLADFEDCGCNK